MCLPKFALLEDVISDETLIDSIWSFVINTIGETIAFVQPKLAIACVLERIHQLTAKFGAAHFLVAS